MIFRLLLPILLAGCVSLPRSFHALHYRNQTVFLDRHHSYKVGPLSEGWQMQANKNPGILFKHKDYHATIATEALCGAAFEDLSLDLLTEHLLVGLKNIKKSKDIQPRDTWVLDLDKEQKDLLAVMHPKTRYNIALANKKGVKVRFSKKEADLKYFFRLNKKTASRNQITTHPDDYYQKLFQVLVDKDAGELALAEIDGQIVAANILIYFGQSATYLHGASDYAFRQYMAPQLLQWESIKRAHSLGKKIYDFWGIAPQDGSKPNWEGFSRFKKSFGGRAIYSPGAHDLIYDSFWYTLYNLNTKVKSLLKK